MRTYRELVNWEGIWIIGMATVKARVNQAVVYMMKVMEAFESQRDLWLSDCLPTRMKNAKAAHEHRLGDLFQPVSGKTNPFSKDSYRIPRGDHSHAPTDWYKDISYKGIKGRRPALLVGDPEYSFIWEIPRIVPCFRPGRYNNCIDISEFRDYFEEY